MLACNSGRERHKQGRQEWAANRKGSFDFADFRREALQRATYLHGELKAVLKGMLPLLGSELAADAQFFLGTVISSGAA